MDNLIEIIPINDTYSDGIACVENLGTCCRVFFYTWARSPDGKFERQVVAKIVRPLASLERGTVSRMLPRTPRLDEDGKILN